MDVNALEGHIYALDSEGVLCVLNEQRKLEKWMDLKVHSSYTLHPSTHNNIEKGNIKASQIIPGPETFADVIALITDEVRGRLIRPH